MPDWNYDQKAYDDNQFAIIPVGDHRVRIDAIKESISRSSGMPMLEITLSVSGFSSKLWFYLVFKQSEPDKTNRALGSIFDSFGIRQGDLNIQNWTNKVGGARIRHETYDGQSKPRIAYFISADRVAKLPPWQGSEPNLAGDYNLPFDI